MTGADEARGGSSPAWDLFFLLPNLNVPKPTPFDAGVVRICAGDDPILDRLQVNPGNTTARQMLGAFRDQYGKPYIPGCLIVSAEAPARVREATALRAFRNCCAVATILPAYEGGQWQPKFADHFDIYPLGPGKNGSIVTNDAIVQGLSEQHGFIGQCSPSIQMPWNFQCRPSKRLLTRLFQAWTQCYLLKRRRRLLQRLFRSLAIALHASRFPTDSLISVHDAGLRLVVWVSAFEILLHPRGGRIALPVVLAYLRSLSWLDRRLPRRCYRITYPNVPRSVSISEAIYFDLYKARNDFAHGNEVPSHALRFRRNRRLGYLPHVAPPLYRVVLEHQLGHFLPAQNVQPPPAGSLRWFLTPRGKRYLRESGTEWADRTGTESALLRCGHPSKGKEGS
jgi:hypothetical protein